MRSDAVKSGPERAPHRSLWKAMGLTNEELARPLIGVVSAKSECVPGHAHLDAVTRAVKDGVRMAGGVPVEFPSIGVCDGIAMGHAGMKYSLAPIRANPWPLRTGLTAWSSSPTATRSCPVC